MRQRVFDDDAQRKVLEGILHPMIATETALAIEAAQSPYVLWMVPLLAEGKGRSRADRVLVVDCPEAMQIERVMARSNLSRAQVLAIMQRQSSRAQRLALADDVIENIGGVDETDGKVRLLHTQYLVLARRQNEERL
jgi:dephospho-CoA kinase